MIKPFGIVLVAVASCSALAAAQPQRPETKKAPPPVAAVPQQTTATFGDWTLRCAQPAGAAKSCEVVQLVQSEGRPIAEVAIGVPGKGRSMAISALVPTNVSLGGPALVQAAGDNGGSTALNWQRCLPGGCIAGAEIGDEIVTRIRGWTQPGRLVFANGAGQPVVLPISPSGLPQALDALGRENAG